MNSKNEELDFPSTYKGDSVMKKTALFLSGFSLLLTLRVALNGAPFCIKRFQLEENLFSFYTNRVHSAMELFGLIAVCLGTIYVQTYQKHFEYISIGISLAFWLINIILVFVFITGGEKGHLTAFYWTLVASSFIYGLNQVFAFQLGGESIVYYLAAIPLSGIMVSLFQVLVLHIFDKREGINIDLVVIALQISLSVIIAMVSAILWAKVFLEPDNSFENQLKRREESQNGKDEEGGMDFRFKTYGRDHDKVGVLKNFPAISPIVLCIVGLGTVYAFYPGIAPGSIVDFNWINKVDVVLMILSSFPSVFVALISETTEYGPNRPWTGNNGFWHLFLLLPILQVSCEVIFLKVLHFPFSGTAKFFENPKVAGFFTILFFMCHSISIGIGFVGVLPNSNTSVNTINLFVTLFTMNFLQFLGGGYLAEYKKYERINWPTRAMDEGEAFYFWLKNGAFNALNNIRCVFTRNLRRDLLVSLLD